MPDRTPPTHTAQEGDPPRQFRSLSFRVTESTQPHHVDRTDTAGSLLDRVKRTIRRLRKKEPEIYPLW